MQIKTTKRYHLTPVRMAIIKQQTTSAGKGMEKSEPYYTVAGNAELVQPLWKTVWNFLKKLKMELPYDPVILLLGIYLKNPETPIQDKLCTLVFTAALFTKAKY